jgi:hypothetical protein
MIASVIFAPAAQNCTLSLATTPQRFGEALVFGSVLDKDEYELVTRRISENIQLASTQDRAAATQYLADWLGASNVTAAVTLKSWSKPTIEKKTSVPDRSYPFASHLNLLATTVEGMFFDPDDYVER